MTSRISLKGAPEAIKRLVINGCLCGRFESCDSCRPRRLTRLDCEREDAAQALDTSNHPCVQLGDE